MFFYISIFPCQHCMCAFSFCMNTHPCAHTRKFTYKYIYMYIYITKMPAAETLILIQSKFSDMENMLLQDRPEPTTSLLHTESSICWATVMEHFPMHHLAYWLCSYRYYVCKDTHAHTHTQIYPNVYAHTHIYILCVFACVCTLVHIG